MVYEPTYELNLMIESESQFEKIKEAINECDLKKNEDLEEPIFQKIHLMTKRQEDIIEAGMRFGCWKYSEIYSRAVLLLGAENVKIGLDGVSYDFAFSEELKNKGQFDIMRKNQVVRALKTATRIEWNSDLYKCLRKNYNQEITRSMIFEGKLDQISFDLQSINKTLCRMIDSMESSHISDFQKDLLEEQREQM